VWHRNHQNVPTEVFGTKFLVGSDWSNGALEAMLVALGKPKINRTPSGLQLTSVGESPVEAARLFAAALVPLASEYPFPFAEVAP